MKDQKGRISHADIRECVENNLLPLSNSDTVSEAVLEWCFLGTINDFESRMANCEVLKLPQRFLCRILNEKTQKEAWVAPQIIYRLPITAYSEEKYVVHPGNLKRYVEKLLNDQRANACLCRLITLAGPRERESVLEGLSQLRIEKVIRPSAMLVILDLLERYNIEWSEAWFTVCTRINDLRRGSRHEWRELKDWQVWRLWPLLNDQDRLQCIKKMGFRPPPEFSTEK